MQGVCQDIAVHLKFANMHLQISLLPESLVFVTHLMLFCSAAMLQKKLKDRSSIFMQICHKMYLLNKQFLLSKGYLQ